MRVAFVGAGAVGCYYGGKLAAAGADVSFLARHTSFRALRQNGILITEDAREVAIAVEVVEDPAELGPVDAVFVAVKHYDLERAADALKPHLRRRTAVVSMQNGVDGIERLGWPNALAAVVYGGCQLVAPGHVRRVGALETVLFGGRDSKTAAHASELAAMFRGCEIDADVSKDIDRTLWTKMVLFATMSAACCLSRLTTGPLLASKEARELVLAGMREVEAVARAKGVALDENASADALKLALSMDPASAPSMLRDLEKGLRPELDAASGAVARMGESLDVPTPFHNFAAALLAPHANPNPNRRP